MQGPIAFDHMNMDYQYDANIPSQFADNDDAFFTHLQQRTGIDTKDSMELQQGRIPSILVDCIISNIRQRKGLNYNNNTATNIRKFPYCPSYNDTTDNENHMIYPIMYYDSERRTEYPSRNALCHKSASRPIRRTQQEKNRLQMEDKMRIAFEIEYDHATWRMYHRIMKYRQKCPLPDSYYEEISSRRNNNNNCDGSVDIMASDITDTTCSSTASSPSSNSPKFAPIRHSSTIIKKQDDQSRIQGLPTIVSSSSSTTDHQNVVLVHNDMDDTEHDDLLQHEDEYSEMMMFDLEL